MFSGEYVEPVRGGTRRGRADRVERPAKETDVTGQISILEDAIAKGV